MAEVATADEVETMEENAIERFTRLEPEEMDKLPPNFKREVEKVREQEEQQVSRPVTLERLRRKYRQNRDNLDAEERETADARLRELNALQTEIGLSPEYNHIPDNAPATNPQDDIPNAYTFIRLSNNVLGTGTAQTTHATYGDYIRDPFFDKFNTVVYYNPKTSVAYFSASSSRPEDVGGKLIDAMGVFVKRYRRFTQRKMGGYSLSASMMLQKIMEDPSIDNGVTSVTLFNMPRPLEESRRLSFNDYVTQNPKIVLMGVENENNKPVFEFNQNFVLNEQSDNMLNMQREFLENQYESIQNEKATQQEKRDRENETIQRRTNLADDDTSVLRDEVTQTKPVSSSTLNEVQTGPNETSQGWQPVDVQYGGESGRGEGPVFTVYTYVPGPNAEWARPELDFDGKIKFDFQFEITEETMPDDDLEDNSYKSNVFRPWMEHVPKLPRKLSAGASDLTRFNQYTFHLDRQWNRVGDGLDKERDKIFAMIKGLGAGQKTNAFGKQIDPYVLNLPHDVNTEDLTKASFVKAALFNIRDRKVLRRIKLGIFGKHASGDRRGYGGASTYNDPRQQFVYENSRLIYEELERIFYPAVEDYVKRNPQVLPEKSILQQIKEYTQTTYLQEAMLGLTGAEEIGEFIGGAVGSIVGSLAGGGAAAYQEIGSRTGSYFGQKLGSAGMNAFTNFMTKPPRPGPEPAPEQEALGFTPVDRFELDVARPAMSGTGFTPSRTFESDVVGPALAAMQQQRGRFDYVTPDEDLGPRGQEAMIDFIARGVKIDKELATQKRRYLILEQLNKVQNKKFRKKKDGDYTGKFVVARGTGTKVYDNVPVNQRRVLVTGDIDKLSKTLLKTSFVTKAAQVAGEAMLDLAMSTPFILAGQAMGATVGGAFGGPTGANLGRVLGGMTGSYVYSTAGKAFMNWLSDNMPKGTKLTAKQLQQIEEIEDERADKVLWITTAAVGQFLHNIYNGRAPNARFYGSHREALTLLQQMSAADRNLVARVRAAQPVLAYESAVPVDLSNMAGQIPASLLADARRGSLQTYLLRMLQMDPVHARPIFQRLANADNTNQLTNAEAWQIYSDWLNGVAPDLMQNVFLRGMQAATVASWLNNMEDSIYRQRSTMFVPGPRPRQVPSGDYAGLLDSNFTPGPGPGVYPDYAMAAPGKRVRFGIPAQSPAMRKQKKAKRTVTSKSSKVPVPKLLKRIMTSKPKPTKSKGKKKRRGAVAQYKLLALFNRLDKDKSGRLTVDELKPLVRALGTSGESLLRIMDQDKNNSITFAEFARYMRSRAAVEEN